MELFCQFFVFHLRSNIYFTADHMICLEIKIVHFTIVCVLCFILPHTELSAVTWIPILYSTKTTDSSLCQSFEGVSARYRAHYSRTYRTQSLTNQGIEGHQFISIY